MNQDTEWYKNYNMDSRGNRRDPSSSLSEADQSTSQTRPAASAAQHYPAPSLQRFPPPQQQHISGLATLPQPSSSVTATSGHHGRNPAETEYCAEEGQAMSGIQQYSTQTQPRRQERFGSQLRHDFSGTQRSTSGYYGSNPSEVDYSETQDQPSTSGQGHLRASERFGSQSRHGLSGTQRSTGGHYGRNPSEPDYSGAQGQLSRSRVQQYSARPRQRHSHRREGLASLSPPGSSETQRTTSDPYGTKPSETDNSTSQNQPASGVQQYPEQSMERHPPQQEQLASGCRSGASGSQLSAYRRNPSDKDFSAAQGQPSTSGMQQYPEQSRQRRPPRQERFVSRPDYSGTQQSTSGYYGRNRTETDNSAAQGQSSTSGIQQYPDQSKHRHLPRQERFTSPSRPSYSEARQYTSTYYGRNRSEKDYSAAQGPPSTSGIEQYPEQSKRPPPRRRFTSPPRPGTSGTQQPTGGSIGRYQSETDCSAAQCQPSTSRIQQYPEQSMQRHPPGQDQFVSPPRPGYSGTHPSTSGHYGSSSFTMDYSADQPPTSGSQHSVAQCRQTHPPPDGGHIESVYQAKPSGTQQSTSGPYQRNLPATDYSVPQATRIGEFAARSLPGTQQSTSFHYDRNSTETYQVWPSTPSTQPCYAAPVQGYAPPQQQQQHILTRSQPGPSGIQLSGPWHYDRNPIEAGQSASQAWPSTSGTQQHSRVPVQSYVPLQQSCISQFVQGPQAGVAGIQRHPFIERTPLHSTYQYSAVSIQWVAPSQQPQFQPPTTEPQPQQTTAEPQPRQTITEPQPQQPTAEPQPGPSGTQRSAPEERPRSPGEESPVLNLINCDDIITGYLGNPHLISPLSRLFIDPPPPLRRIPVTVVPYQIEWYERTWKYIPGLPDLPNYTLPSSYVEYVKVDPNSALPPAYYRVPHEPHISEQGVPEQMLARHPANTDRNREHAFYLYHRRNFKDSFNRIMAYLADCSDEYLFIFKLQQFRHFFQHLIIPSEVELGYLTVLRRCFVVISQMYEAVANETVPRYLEIMEDLLVVFGDIVGTAFGNKNAEERSEFMDEIVGDIIYLACQCLYYRLDSIFHFLFKMHIRPGEGIVFLMWTQIYFYFMDKLKCVMNRHDLGRCFVAWQRIIMQRDINHTDGAAMIPFMLQRLRRLTLENLENDSPLLRHIINSMRTRLYYPSRTMTEDYFKWWRFERFWEHDVDVDDPTTIFPGVARGLDGEINVILASPLSRLRGHARFVANHRSGRPQDKTDDDTEEDSTVPEEHSSSVPLPDFPWPIGVARPGLPVVSTTKDNTCDFPAKGEQRIVATIDLESPEETDEDDDDDVIFNGYILYVHSKFDAREEIPDQLKQIPDRTINMLFHNQQYTIEELLGVAVASPPPTVEIECIEIPDEDIPEVSVECIEILDDETAETTDLKPDINVTAPKSLADDTHKIEGTSIEAHRKRKRGLESPDEVQIIDILDSSLNIQDGKFVAAKTTAEEVERGGPDAAQPIEISDSSGNSQDDQAVVDEISIQQESKRGRKEQSLNTVQPIQISARPIVEGTSSQGYEECPEEHTKISDGADRQNDTAVVNETSLVTHASTHVSDEGPVESFAQMSISDSSVINQVGKAGVEEISTQGERQREIESPVQCVPMSDSSASNQDDKTVEETSTQEARQKECESPNPLEILDRPVVGKISSHHDISVGEEYTETSDSSDGKSDKPTEESLRESSGQMEISDSSENSQDDKVIVEGTSTQDSQITVKGLDSVQHIGVSDEQTSSQDDEDSRRGHTETSGSSDSQGDKPMEDSTLELSGQMERSGSSVNSKDDNAVVEDTREVPYVLTEISDSSKENVEHETRLSDKESQDATSEESSVSRSTDCSTAGSTNTTTSEDMEPSDRSQDKYGKVEDTSSGISDGSDGQDNSPMEKSPAESSGQTEMSDSSVNSRENREVPGEFSDISDGSKGSTPSEHMSYDANAKSMDAKTSSDHDDEDSTSKNISDDLRESQFIESMASEAPETPIQDVVASMDEETPVASHEEIDNSAYVWNVCRGASALPKEPEHRSDDVHTVEDTPELPYEPIDESDFSIELLRLLGENVAAADERYAHKSPKRQVKDATGSPPTAESSSGAQQASGCLLALGSDEDHSCVLCNGSPQIDFYSWSNGSNLSPRQTHEEPLEQRSDDGELNTQLSTGRRSPDHGVSTSFGQPSTSYKHLAAVSEVNQEDIENTLHKKSDDNIETGETVYERVVRMWTETGQPLIDPVTEELTASQEEPLIQKTDAVSDEPKESQNDKNKKYKLVVVGTIKIPENDGGDKPKPDDGDKFTDEIITELLDDPRESHERSGVEQTTTERISMRPEESDVKETTSHSKDDKPVTVETDAAADKSQESQSDQAEMTKNTISQKKRRKPGRRRKSKTKATTAEPKKPKEEQGGKPVAEELEDISDKTEGIQSKEPEQEKAERKKAAIMPGKSTESQDDNPTTEKFAGIADKPKESQICKPEEEKAKRKEVAAAPVKSIESHDDDKPATEKFVDIPGRPKESQSRKPEKENPKLKKTTSMPVKSKEIQGDKLVTEAVADISDTPKVSSSYKPKKEKLKGKGTKTLPVGSKESRGDKPMPESSAVILAKPKESQSLKAEKEKHKGKEGTARPVKSKESRDDKPSPEKCADIPKERSKESQSHKTEKEKHKRKETTARHAKSKDKPTTEEFADVSGRPTESRSHKPEKEKSKRKEATSMPGTSKETRDDKPAAEVTDKVDESLVDKPGKEEEREREPTTEKIIVPAKAMESSDAKSATKKAAGESEKLTEIPDVEPKSEESIVVPERRRKRSSVEISERPTTSKQDPEEIKRRRKSEVDLSMATSDKSERAQEVSEGKSGKRRRIRGDDVEEDDTTGPEKRRKSQGIVDVGTSERSIGQEPSREVESSELTAPIPPHTVESSEDIDEPPEPPTTTDEENYCMTQAPQVPDESLSSNELLPCNARLKIDDAASQELPTEKPQVIVVKMDVTLDQIKAAGATNAWHADIGRVSGLRSRSPNTRVEKGAQKLINQVVKVSGKGCLDPKKKATPCSVNLDKIDYNKPSSEEMGLGKQAMLGAAYIISSEQSSKTTRSVPETESWWPKTSRVGVLPSKSLPADAEEYQSNFQNSSSFDESSSVPLETLDKNEVDKRQKLRVLRWNSSKTDSSTCSTTSNESPQTSQEEPTFVLDKTPQTSPEKSTFVLDRNSRERSPSIQSTRPYEETCELATVHLVGQEWTVPLFSSDNFGPEDAIVETGVHADVEEGKAVSSVKQTAVSPEHIPQTHSLADVYTNFAKEVSIDTQEDNVTTIEHSMVNLISSSNTDNNKIVIQCQSVLEPLKESDVSNAGGVASLPVTLLLTPNHEPDQQEFLSNPSSYKILLPQRRNTEDEKTNFSGSQPYTPQSSPSARICSVTSSQDAGNTMLYAPAPTPSPTISQFVVPDIVHHQDVSDHTPAVPSKISDLPPKANVLRVTSPQNVITAPVLTATKNHSVTFFEEKTREIYAKEYGDRFEKKKDLDPVSKGRKRVSKRPYSRENVEAARLAEPHSKPKKKDQPPRTRSTRPKRVHITAEDNDLFQNGIEGPVGKALRNCSGSAPNMLWDDVDEPNKVGTISMKPDSQLYRGKNENLVSILKRPKPKGEFEYPKRKDPHDYKLPAQLDPNFFNAMGENALNDRAVTKQDDSLDYTFRNLLIPQNNIVAPQHAIIHSEIPNNINYYSSLPLSVDNQFYFYSYNTKNHQEPVLVPAENLPEIDPNLLHTEKIVPKSEDIELTTALEGEALEQEYSEEIPYLSLSRAFLGDSLSTEKAERTPENVMFNDNPFIGQRYSEDTRSPIFNTNLETTSQSILGSDNSLIFEKDMPRVATELSNGFLYQPNEALPVPLYDPTQTNNMYYNSQETGRLPDVSTLKDPRKTYNHIRAEETVKDEKVYSVHAPTLPTISQRIEHTGVLPLDTHQYSSSQNSSSLLYRKTHDVLAAHKTAKDQNPIVEPNVVTTRSMTLKLQTKENGVGESPVKTPLPPKKRKLTEDEELAIYIQKFKEEKERKKLEENISYPAQRQMSIADLQRDFPKVKTLAARKIYPEGTTGSYPDQNYYDYPQGYDQCNDYGNKRSIMNVYINGVRECSANYPLCLMIGTMHTCVNNQSTTEGIIQHPTENPNQTRAPQEAPMYADQQGGYVGQTSLPNMPTKHVVQEIPTSRAKRGETEDDYHPRNHTNANGQRIPPDKRKNDQLDEIPSKKSRISVRTDLLEKKPKKISAEMTATNPHKRRENFVDKNTKISTVPMSNGVGPPGILKNGTMPLTRSIAERTKSGRVRKTPNYYDVTESTSGRRKTRFKL